MGGPHLHAVEGHHDGGSTGNPWGGPHLHAVEGHHDAPHAAVLRRGDVGEPLRCGGISGVVVVEHHHHQLVRHLMHVQHALHVELRGEAVLHRLRACLDADGTCVRWYMCEM
eukprot:4429226-Pyramimonas_sp.AAC.1